jgi:hypothetical protein
MYPPPPRRNDMDEPTLICEDAEAKKMRVVFE